MAIAETGTRGSVNASAANTGMTTAITVPADCEILIVAVTADTTTASFFSGGTMTWDSTGTAQAMTAIAADTGSGQKGAIFYRKSPTTGNKTLAWDWSGAGAADTGLLLAYTFWKGIDTTNTPRHGAGAQQTTNTHTSGTLTASSGDTIVAFAFTFSNDVERTWTWTSANTTELAEVSQFNFADGCWATAAPTGNQAMTADCSLSDEGGVVGIVLIPAGGNSSSVSPSVSPSSSVSASPSPSASLSPSASQSPSSSASPSVAGTVYIERTVTSYID